MAVCLEVKNYGLRHERVASGSPKQRPKAEFGRNQKMHAFASHLTTEQSNAAFRLNSHCWLFDRYALREVSRLIDIGSALNRNIVSEQLQRDTHHDGREKMRRFRKRQDCKRRRL